MNKKIIILISGIAVIIVLGIIIGFTNKEKEENVEDLIQGEENETEIEIETETEKDEINKLKENTGKTGDTDLYEIQEGDNNIKIATIKSSVKYKVAFSGLVENAMPEMDKIDSILQEKHPKETGIWVFESDRENILEMIKEITKSEYKIDENGYLKIVNKNNQNENDKKIEKAINSEKIYIIRNSSTCYIVDEVTGEILDYNFEKLDRYQTYEYFEDGNKTIIFITENSKKQLTQKEIFQSVIELF